MTRTGGPFVADFAETLLRVSKGQQAGQLVLRDWQRGILNELFTLRPDGLRQYRRGLLGMPRKNGKSLIGSVIALYGLFADGEEGAEVYSCAGDRYQAGIVFDEAKRMVQSSPDLMAECKIYRDAIEVPGTNSVYRVLSAEAGTKEGLNPSLVIFDEVHVQPNDELWDVMTLGSGARQQPLTLGITTAGHDRDSLCYRLYQRGKRIESGEVDDPAFYFRWWEPDDPDCDYDDRGQWFKANPGLGDFLSLEDMELASRNTPEAAFRRYKLNQWTLVRDSWLPTGAWDKCADPDHEVTPGVTECVLTFDGAWSNDSTGLLLTTLEDTPHIKLLNVWERPIDDPHWRVDVLEVEQAIADAVALWQPAEVACDPARWQRSMAILEAGRAPMVEYPQTLSRMVPATQRLYDAVVSGGVTHDGSPALARHVANAIVKTDRAGSRIAKENKASSRKIDLAVCAIMGFDRAAHAARRGSVYESRGVLTF